MIDRRLMAEADRLGQLDYAMKEGIKQGIERGRQMAEADWQGQLDYAAKEGSSDRALEIARTALAKGLDADTVASITGLDITIIEELAAELL